MKKNSSFPMVEKIMLDFARQSGLSPVTDTPRRYLWTDAFAVCNYLELYRQSGDNTFQELALTLVDQVHQMLGRHRPDDSRTGWISGLDEAQGKLHPTSGGLRIGKEMNERGPADAFDADLEWERDGQYYHYLTKWMQALNRVSTVTSDPTYNLWAKELAKTVHVGFVTDLVGQKQIHWKMSIDLSHPLVPSMGHHDPLDGFITYYQLKACGPQESENSQQQPELSREISELEAMCEGRSWATNDALGIGGLLCDAYQMAQMIAAGKAYFPHQDLLAAMLDDALSGLRSFAGTDVPMLTAGYRLAFRELGLTIGLQAAARLQSLLAENPGPFADHDRLADLLTQLLRYKSFVDTIERFWLAVPNREAKTWTEHLDINMVMLATSLAPDCFLRICAND